MKWNSENIKEFIRELLSQDPYSQEYVDCLVSKALDELAKLESATQSKQQVGAPQEII